MNKLSVIFMAAVVCCSTLMSCGGDSKHPPEPNDQVIKEKLIGKQWGLLKIIKDVKNDDGTIVGEPIITEYEGSEGYGYSFFTSKPEKCLYLSVDGTATMFNYTISNNSIYLTNISSPNESYSIGVQKISEIELVTKQVTKNTIITSKYKKIKDIN